MTDPVLLSEDIEDIRLLTLNRPKALNALNSELVGAIVGAVDAAHLDDGVSVIVLAGNERAFSAGADLKEAQSRRGDDAEAARRHAALGGKLYQVGERTDKPIIAAVRGYVLGGGCNLAISADLVVAGESAVFGYPELKRGLAATAVTPGLVHRIGPKAAFEMLALAENVTPQRAYELGMINRVVPDDEVIDTALGMARALAAFDGAAVRTTKRVFQKSTKLSLSQSLDIAREAALLMRASGDRG
jgi:enoyl-CoA hydratase/carnithine racemase